MQIQRIGSAQARESARAILVDARRGLCRILADDEAEPGFVTTAVRGAGVSANEWPILRGMGASARLGTPIVSRAPTGRESSH